MAYITFKRKKNIDHLKKIAVDLPHGLGDQIMCFPLFASLKKARPDLHITAVTSNRSSSMLLACNPHIDAVKIYDIRFSLWGALRFFLGSFWRLRAFFKQEQFDLYIIVHPNHFRDIMLLLLPYTSALVNKEHTHKTREVHNILQALNIPAINDYSFQVPVQADLLKNHNLQEKSYIVLDLYAQHLDKDPRQWPYFKELIEYLVEHRYKIVTVGLHPEHTTIPGVVDLVNHTSLKELWYLVQKAGLVVAMDTGLFHFAYSQSTPVVGLFGPVDPQERIPLQANGTVQVLYSGLYCSPCIKNKVTVDCVHDKEKNACMRGITVDDVVAKIEELYI